MSMFYNSLSSSRAHGMSSNALRVHGTPLDVATSRSYWCFLWARKEIPEDPLVRLNNESFVSKSNYEISDAPMEKFRTSGKMPDKTRTHMIFYYHLLFFWGLTICVALTQNSNQGKSRKSASQDLRSHGKSSNQEYSKKIKKQIQKFRNSEPQEP